MIPNLTDSLSFQSPGPVEADDRTDKGRVPGQVPEPASKDRPQPVEPIDRLRSVIRARLRYLARNPELVRRVVGFHWTRRLER
jgi:hypothetical protein